MIATAVASLQLRALEVLAEPNRRRILDLLRERELPVGDLVRALAVSQPAVSKHLRVLREARLIIVVAPPGADGRKQFHEIPAPFRTRDAAGRTVLDFGAVVLRL